MSIPQEIIDSLKDAVEIEQCKTIKDYEQKRVRAHDNQINSIHGGSMRGVVWYKNREVGEDQFESIINNYHGIKIVRQRRGFHVNEVIFENGDIWKLVPAHEGRRGLRPNVSYVERCIDPEFFQTVIYPKTFYPYGAFAFYGEGSLGIGLFPGKIKKYTVIFNKLRYWISKSLGKRN